MTWNSYDQSNPTLAPFTGVTYEVIVKDSTDTVVKQLTGLTTNEVTIDGLNDQEAHKVTVIGKIGSVTSPVSAVASVTTKKVSKWNPAFYISATSPTDLTNGSLNLKGATVKFTYHDNTVGLIELTVDTSAATNRQEVFNSIKAAIDGHTTLKDLVTGSYTASNYQDPWDSTKPLQDNVLYFEAVKSGSDVRVELIGHDNSGNFSYSGGGSEN